MPTIDILGFAQSTFVRTARMTCIEKGAEHRLVPLEFRQASHRSLHPFLRMPVMRAGDVTLYETLAITHYLEETFPGPRLMPADALGRARVLQWISICSDYLYDSQVRAFLRDGPPEAEVIDAAHGDLAVVEPQLAAGPYALGQALSLADLFLAPIVEFAASQTAMAAVFTDLPNITAWRTRMASRSSMAQTVA